MHFDTKLTLPVQVCLYIETMSTMTTVKMVNKYNSMLLKWCPSNLHKNLNQSNIYSTLLKSIICFTK